MPLNVFDQFRQTTSRDGAGYQRVVRRGTVSGPDATAYFESRTTEEFQAQYPSPDFTVQRSVTVSNDLAAVEYELSAEGQNAATIPGVEGSVLGRSLTSVRRGAGLRKIRTVRREAVTSGDPWALADALRQSENTPYEERVFVTVAPRGGARVIQTFVESADGSDLLEWRQYLEDRKGAARTLAHSYPGAEPVYVEGPLEGGVRVQRGYAIGLRRFPREPEPISAEFAALPVIRFEVLNDWEWKTSWKYVLSARSAELPAGALSGLGRPGAPQFYGTAAL